MNRPEQIKEVVEGLQNFQLKLLNSRFGVQIA